MTTAGNMLMLSGGGGSPTTPIMTLNLNGANISALTCSVNGLTNATLFGFARNLASFFNTPGWTEGSGGWGGTYFGMNGAAVEVRFGSGSSNSKKQFPFTQTPNTWYHFCFVRYSSSYIFYLNGVQFAVQSGGTTAMKNNKDTFNLAKGFNDDQLNDNESVVAYGMFSRALSSAEVAELYALKLIDTSKPPFNNGLLMGVNVTEGSGNKIYDVVSGNYMTINSTPNWTVEFNP